MVTKPTFILVCFCVCARASVRLGLPAKLINCVTAPSYITPHDIMACSCNASKVEGPESQAFLEWTRAQDGSVVEKGSVNQNPLPLPLGDLAWSDSGKRFDCYLVFPQNSSRVLVGSYIPLIAYGPVNVTISSNHVFIPEDGSTMTLTCQAKVNPRPTFLWKGDPASAMMAPGCRCLNGTFSELLTFDPRVVKDGDVIFCQVTNRVADWSSTETGTFILRSMPDRGVVVSLTQYVAVAGSLAALLLISLVALFFQCRRNRNTVVYQTIGGPPASRGQPTAQGNDGARQQNNTNNNGARQQPPQPPPPPPPPNNRQGSNSGRRRSGNNVSNQLPTPTPETAADQNVSGRLQPPSRGRSNPSSPNAVRRQLESSQTYMKRLVEGFRATVHGEGS